MTINVTSPSADRNEKIDIAIDVIGKSQDTLEFFDAVYTKKNKVKTISDVLNMSSIKSEVRVLQVGKKLASHDIVKIIKDNKTKRTAYEKIDFYSQNKSKIISAVKNPKQREKIFTKSRPKINLRVTVSTKLKKDEFFSIDAITVDDIDSFRKVLKIKNPKSINPLEIETKSLIQKILGTKGKFTDWGGETDDLFTTNLLVKNKRIHTAFALKGKGTKGKLIPKKMGKNGDQIQRLFRSPAQALIIQYNDQIDSSILELMKELSIAKSAKEHRRIFYGIIDGTDTARIFKAYS